MQTTFNKMILENGAELVAYREKLTRQNKRDQELDKRRVDNDLDR